MTILMMFMMKLLDGSVYASGGSNRSKRNDLMESQTRTGERELFAAAIISVVVVVVLLLALFSFSLLHFYCHCLYYCFCWRL